MVGGPVDRDRIVSLIRTQPYLFGLPERRDADAVAVRLLGSGESYTAWLVEAPHGADGPGGAAAWEPVVVRVARRPVTELPRPLAEEFQALAAVPAGIGPRPILLEESPDLLGSPFMVTGFVPGRPVEPAGWTSTLLRAHARRLAAAHARIHRHSGRVGGPLRERRSTLSLVERFTDNLAWWQSTHPEVVASPDVAALAPLVRDRIATAAPHFERLRRFALVPISGPSWYLPMDDAQVDLLLRAYLDASGTGEETLDSLQARRDAWEVVGLRHWLA